MARRLEAALRGLPEVKFVFPRQTNGVFVRLPKIVIEGLFKRGWKFYPHIHAEDCRLMCSWDTTEEDVDAFVADVKELTG